MRFTRYLTLGLSLFGFWLLLSGQYSFPFSSHFEPRVLGFGVLSVLLVTFVVWLMDRQDLYDFPLTLSWTFAVYVFWLVIEVFRANVKVARIILDPKLPISPIMVPFRARMLSDLCRVIYANSITLTPGTITTGTEGDLLRIHALTWHNVDGREEDDMGMRICALESVARKERGG
jgi:multicomponent Na+:H+ antiporter subunit E